ncbi:hypothetical protein D3C73_715370 [compost metagenome]
MRAVLARAHGHTFQIQQGSQIVRMRAVDQERHHRCLFRRFADDAQAVDAAQLFGEVRQQFGFAGFHVLLPKLLQVVGSHAQADETGDVWGAGFELVRGIVEHGAVEADFLDHLAAAQERRHRVQVLATGPQRTSAGRAAHLVAGDGVEVAADRGDIDLAVRCGLRAVDHGDDAALAGFATDLAHRVDGAEHVGDVGHGQQLDLGGHRRAQCVQVQRAVGGDLGHADGRAGALGHQLPRHDVGVVLHARNQDHVAGLQPRQGPGVRNEIDREGGAAAQHQVVAAHVEETGQLVARALVGVGGLGTQRVHRTADVGVVAAVELVHRADHLHRLLAGVGVVEIDQRLAVHFAHQQREVQAHAVPVRGHRGIGDRARGGQVHATPASASALSSRRASCSRSASGSTFSGSWQNAALSSACAWACGRPRERR